MTARTDAQAKQERFFAAALEIDLDICQNAYGVSPCSAGRKDSGTAQAGSSSSITLRAGASSVNDAYTGMTMFLTGGTGSGQERAIIGYNGSTKIATIAGTYSPVPNNTTTYNVIDRPNACYNTFGTCQDKPNYVKGTQTYKFCSRAIAKLPPGELVRPYIQEWQSAPTEIDPQGGLARSSKTTLTLVDEPSTDFECDKYFSRRVAPAAGTFLTRLRARNINYFGRFARLRLGYPVDPWDWNTFQTELYIVDSMEFDKDGNLIVDLKDPIKLADNTSIPAPSDGTLSADILIGATSLTLATGKGAQYGSSGVIRIGDEVLSFSSRSTDTLNGLTHALFGTVAAAHKTNDKVQLCKTYTSTALTDIIISLLNASGVSSTYIDTAQMASENTRWLSQYVITVCLTEPTAPSKYIGELCRESNSMMWWHPVQQKFKFKVNMPESGTSTTPLFDEVGNFIEKSIAVDILDDERLTYGAFFCNLSSAVANRSEDKNYLFGSIFIDTDAESVNEYGDRRTEVIRSRFLTASNALAAIATASRMVSWRRDAPFKFSAHIDPKDYTIQVGDLIDISTRKIVDPAGNNKISRVRVVKLEDKGTHIALEARSTKFRNRYGFIAPNGTPDYPTDTVFAHIATSPGQLMGNGDAPYLTI
jgi:hypothetical protein